jgi:hypothetical protein
MALFTDGLLSSLDDLTAMDSQLTPVAATEEINVTQKLTLAQDEIGLELKMLLARLMGQDAPELNSVVSTPALKLWHTYLALEMVYADAYNNQLNDRYAGRREQFKAKAQQARERLIEIGVGIAHEPVPQAKTPEVTTATSAYLTDGTYYVTMAWVNRRGEEGAGATPAAITTSNGTFLVTPADPPETAAGWNVYAGSAPDAMVLQNGTPLGTNETWLQPALAYKRRAPGTGQPPSYLGRLPRLIQRG